MSEVKWSTTEMVFFSLLSTLLGAWFMLITSAIYNSTVDDISKRTAEKLKEQTTIEETK